MRTVDLPDDALCSILAHLPPKEVLRMRLVCRSWGVVALDDTIWNQLFAAHFADFEVPEEVLPLPAVQRFAYAQAHLVPFRWSLHIDDRNPRMVVARDGSWAQPDNDDWNAVQADRDLKPGYRYSWGVRITCDNRYTTFRFGISVTDERLALAELRSGVGIDTFMGGFYGINEYSEARVPNTAERPRSAQPRPHGADAFYLSGEVLGFELSPTGILTHYLDGYKIFEFPEPIAFGTAKFIRFVGFLSGADLRAELVPLKKRPEGEQLPTRTLRPSDGGRSDEDSSDSRSVSD